MIIPQIISQKHSERSLARINKKWNLRVNAGDAVVYNGRGTSLFPMEERGTVKGANGEKLIVQADDGGIMALHPVMEVDYE
jgi:hypothetical protein